VENCSLEQLKLIFSKQKRKKLIQGLEQALSILEDETVFVQRKKRGGA